MRGFKIQGHVGKTARAVRMVLSADHLL